MTDEKFSLQIVTEDIVRKETMNLNGSTTTSNGDTSIKNFKSTVNIHLS